MVILNTIRHFFFVYRATLLAKLFYLKHLGKVYPQHPKTGSTKLTSVLHINTFDSGGGAASIASGLCDYQRSIGIHSAMLVSKKKSDSLFVHKIHPLHSRKQHFLSAAQEKLQWQDFFHLSSLQLTEQAPFKQADIIHLHNLHSNYFSPFALPLMSSQKPLVWLLHDMHAFTGHCAHSFECEKWQAGCGNCPDLSSYPAIEKDTTNFILRTKDKLYAKSQLTIVVPSHWLHKKAEKSILSRFPIHTIHNGIDISIYHQVEKQTARLHLGLPENKKIVLFSAEFGTNNPFKGGSFVEEMIKENTDEAVLFVNVGGVKVAEKNKNVWGIPYVDDPKIMAQYYSAADIYLYPTLADNCPLVILESMACGLPVLTFRTGGVPELVVHKQTGYIAEYKNKIDLNTGFRLLLNDDTLRQAMSLNAVERVNSHFTKEIMNQNYLKLYHTLLKQTNHPSPQ